jgi:hypothetical protein
MKLERNRIFAGVLRRYATTLILYIISMKLQRGLTGQFKEKKQRTMINIYLSEPEKGLYAPKHSTIDNRLFYHCVDKKDLVYLTLASKGVLDTYYGVFAAHGCRLVFPVECEDNGTLWRVRDGRKLVKKDGKYEWEDTGNYPVGYDFEDLNDGYSFTSNEKQWKNYE